MTRMPRPLRALAGVLAALALTATACGSEEPADDGVIQEGKGAEAVSVTGDVGESPAYEWTDRVSVDQITTEVLVEGDGAPIADGDLVLTHLSIANGYSKQEVYNDFDTAPQLFTIGTEGLPAAISEGLSGLALGSRVLVVAPPADAFGENGNPQLGLGNGDSVVFVMDPVSTLMGEPDGADVKPEQWMPKVTEEGGLPAGLDFKGTPDPSGDLQVGYLVRGDGPKARRGDTVYVNYLGQVYGGKKPFDQSFAGGQPFPFELGKGQVVDGWDKGLAGVPVGSRVIVAVPPALGYGKEGRPQAGIKKNDTMYFVVDVLGAV